MPHQCRCVICGEIGVITPGLPNVLSVAPPTIQPINPDTSASAQSFTEAMEALAPTLPAAPATCIHGYTKCMPCKFPFPDPFTQSPK